MMVFFKKRTTKSVGRQIGVDLREIEVRKKALRTLEKEEAIRLEKEKLGVRIKEIKARRPTLLKSAVAKGRTFGAGVSKFLETSSKTQPIKRKAQRIRKKATKRVRTKPAKRRNWYAPTGNY